MNRCDFTAWEAAHRARLHAALEAALPSAEVNPARLHAAMRYACEGGKRLRALLVYAAGEAVGVEAEMLDAPAVAVELIHAFSLVHDDLPCMDDDVLRRGKPTVHVEYDEATALLVRSYVILRPGELSQAGQVVSGVLTGSGFLSGVHSPYKTAEKSNCGHFMIAINIEALQPLAQFNARMEQYIDELKSVPLAQGSAEVFYPGEIEANNDIANRRDGLLLPADTLENLASIARDTGLTGLLCAAVPLLVALRGGIIDIFPPGADAPVRLDFFGDALESVRSFDPQSQRTTKAMKSFSLYPANEVLLTPEAIGRFRKGARQDAGNPHPPAAVHGGR